MQMLLVRHGESEPDAATPDWDLSARGEWEARRAGQRLSSVGVTHLVSSSLRRALATAHIIAAELDHRPIEVWPDLSQPLQYIYG